MKLLNRLFAFYINGSIHVALSVVAFTAITAIEFSLRVPWQLYALNFLGTLSAYNFVKYAKIAGLHHRQLARSLKEIQVLSAISAVLLLLLLFQLPFKILLVFACFAIPTFFYAVPLVRHQNLRSLAGLKIFIVALVWAGITVVVPVMASEDSLSRDVWLTFFQRIAIVVALILPFEIRDVPYDSLNLKTLPQLIGVWNTKLLGLGVLVGCIVFEFFKDETGKPYLISFLAFAIVLGAMLVATKQQQNRYFSSFWIEGLPILWLAFYGLALMF